jgi:hypothetical protein
LSADSDLHVKSRKLFGALILIVLAAASLTAINPRVHASQSTTSRLTSLHNGPPISGIFDSASDFMNDAPGVGTVTMATCTDGTNLGGGNIRINCDSTIFPHNEMSIAVDPKDPNHVVAGSNDYELFFQGGFVVERIIAGFYTSFDHGTTWINGHVDPDGFTFNGDPAIAFNIKQSLVHYGTINFNSGQGGGFATASILISTSNDGGKTFGHPVVVALGTGGTTVTVFNDKPYIAVDNNPASPHFGRLYVTYTRFLFNQFGNYLESPIYLSFSDDGGQTFSTPQAISGTSSTLCSQPFVTPRNIGICNEDQFSSPVVGPDGTLYVAFENQEHTQTVGDFRNQYLVVRSTDGGSTFSSPVSAVFPIFDGTDDYPINVNGRQTLTNSQFRVNSAGNLAVDPTSGPSVSGTRLYIAFSDNRNGQLTGNFSTVKTNTDVFVVTSSNGGNDWSPVNPVLTGNKSQNDQFYPWAVVDNSGNLFVAFSDRSYDPANIQYGETLAVSKNHATSFSATRIDSGLSNPNDSRWFTNGGTTNGKATFIGDYGNLAIGSDGATHPIWTDMRTNICTPLTVCFPNPPTGRGHNSQGAVTADPGMTISFTTTISFDTVTVTVSASFTVNATAETLVGTTSVKAINSTTGATIFSKSFNISIGFGTSLTTRLLLSIPSVPLTLAAGCTISITIGGAVCLVTRTPDLNGDGVVDIVDFSAVAFAYGSTTGSTRYNPAADLDANGTVDIIDLSMIAYDYGVKLLQ